MSPRTGRPTDDPKSDRIGLRLTADESKKLDYCCNVLGLTKTEVIRQGIENMYRKAQQKK